MYIKIYFTNFLPQIATSFVSPYYSAFLQGCNNNIKVLKKINYGLRDLERFRVRILLLTKRIAPAIR